MKKMKKRNCIKSERKKTKKRKNEKINNGEDEKEKG
jgi:hypothetical protein